MGFLFENVLQTESSNQESQMKITENENFNPTNMIQTYYENKIEELNIRLILKRYLRQTLKEILTDDRDLDKIFLFEIREILQKVQKRYDESDLLFEKARSGGENYSFIPWPISRELDSYN